MIKSLRHLFLPVALFAVALICLIMDYRNLIFMYNFAISIIYLLICLEK